MGLQENLGKKSSKEVVSGRKIPQVQVSNPIGTRRGGGRASPKCSFNLTWCYWPHIEFIFNLSTWHNFRYPIRQTSVRLIGVIKDGFEICQTSRL